jgi:cyclophilin family peptidyl-prolyl cis-trans isomerase
MAKRKHTAQRSRINTGGERPGFSRRSNLPPPSARRSSTTTWLVVGGVGVIAALAVLAYAAGWIGGPGATPSPAPTGSHAPLPSFANLHPPAATPLANPPAAPAGDGTTATISFPDGDVVIELYNQSSPVAAENFINLARAGYYDGVLVHRVVAGFVAQMGDPTCRIQDPSQCTYGQGGPGYGIPDEPVVGTYQRGTVAMARSSLPNSQGSQFFIVLADGTSLDPAGKYAIFGKVIDGLDVVDKLGQLPNTGGQSGRVLTTYPMNKVTIQAP